MSASRRVLPLSVRLTASFLAAIAVLIAAYGFVAYAFMRQQAAASLDFALQANAEALASLVEQDDESGRWDLEYPAAVADRFSRRRAPDLFFVQLADHTVVAHSDALQSSPKWDERAAQGPVFEDFNFHGRPYRGVQRVVERTHEQEETGRRQTVQVRVFFASSSEEMAARLEHAGGFLVGIGAVLMVVFGLTTALLAWRGLGPVRGLARQTAVLDGDSLHLRLGTLQLPTELRPLADAINRLLERLQAAFERERRFSADAAHELRTPVSILKSGLQAALLDPRAAQDARELLQELLVDVERLEGLCESLLTLAAPAASYLDVGMDLLDWRFCVEITVQYFQERARERGGQLLLEAALLPPDYNPRLRTSAEITQRILGNLLDNALTHGDRGVTVRVRLESLDAGHAGLTIEDDGPGIPEQDRAHLFQRFYCADPARSRRTGGAGLGLAICRHLSEVGGGELTHEAVTPHGCRMIWRVATVAAGRTAGTAAGSG